MTFNEIVFFYLVWIKPQDELEFSDDFKISNDLFKCEHGSKEVVKNLSVSSNSKCVAIFITFLAIMFHSPPLLPQKIVLPGVLKC